MKITIIIFTLSLMYSQTEYPSMNVFFSSNSISLGGAGFLYPSTISSKINPASFNTDRTFTTSIINYKNQISSQSVGLSIPLENSFISSSLKNISYGDFDEYDDNKVLIGKYQSSDSWFSVTYSKKIKRFPLKVGISYKYLSLLLADYQIHEHLFSIGSELYFKKIKTFLGISIHQLDFNFINKYENNFIEPNLVFSFSKILEHLPLNIFIDIISNNYKKEIEFFLGGKFYLNKSFSFQIGSSSRKITQKINNQFFNTIFGYSGIGIVYYKDSMSFTLGSYMYGSGHIINGLQLDIMF